MRSDGASRVKRWSLATIAIVAMFPLGVLDGAAPPPERPSTVGDPISLRFDLAPDESILIERSDRFDLVSRVAGDVVIRSFEPGTFEVMATIRSPGGERTESREVTVASVLSEGDDLKPSPLEPPWSLPPNRAARISIVIAAAAALITWVVLVRRASRSTRTSDEPRRSSVLEDYRRALERVRRMPPGDQRLIALAEITRSFLVQIEPPVGRELTSYEVGKTLEARMVPGLGREIVRDILGEGDFAKFSGWGGRSERFDDLASRASRVVEISGAAGGTA